MPKSISANSSSPAPAEWLLARIADPTRAAAILGDLTEMAATRSRLWFWTAYARTFITLGWRSPIALVCALASMKLMFSTILPWLVYLMPYHLSDAGLFGEQNLRVSLVLWNIPMLIAECLIFALPFALVRFGRRNRFTQLSGVLLLITIPVYAPIPWIRDLSGILTVLAFAVALGVPLWRRPAAVLAATCLTALATTLVSAHTLVAVFNRNFFTLSADTRSICSILGVALAAIVCTHLHRRLLGKPSTAGAMLAESQ